MIVLPGYRTLPKTFLRNPRPEIVWLHSADLAYLAISKVACTSIKRSLAVSEFPGWNYTNESNEVHHLDWRRISKADYLDKETCYFTVVRNPFERLVSCYRNKIISDRQKGKDSFRNYILRPWFGEITFDKFIRRVCRVPDYFAEKHFASQSYVVRRAGRERLDHVFKLETISSDYNVISDRFDVGSLEKLNTTSGDDWRTYYTEELIDLVSVKYRRDIEDFDYEEEYRSLRDFVRAGN